MLPVHKHKAGNLPNQNIAKGSQPDSFSGANDFLQIIPQKKRNQYICKNWGKPQIGDYSGQPVLYYGL